MASVFVISVILYFRIESKAMYYVTAFILIDWLHSLFTFSGSTVNDITKYTVQIDLVTLKYKVGILIFWLVFMQGIYLLGKKIMSSKNKIA